MNTDSWTPPGDDTDRGEAARAWYLRLASGSASVAEVARLREWLAEDPANEAAFAHARAVWKTFDEFAPFTPSAAHVESKRFRARKQRFAAAGVMALAAVVLFLALPSFGWLSADRNSPVGETRAFALADGTQVMLDTNSAIDIAFSDRERRVELVQGQLWVNVADDAARPFVIEAGDAEIRDIGTAFSVRSDDDGLLVDVDEGLVEVALHGGRTRLAADERGRFRDGASRRSILPENARAWRRGRLIFEGQRLGSVLAEVDRYVPGRIVLIGDEAAQRSVTAILDLDHLQGGLDALASTERLDITRITPWLTVIRAR